MWFDFKAGVFNSPLEPASPTSIIDLQNRIVGPGFLDPQINGAYGFDFSEDIAITPSSMSYPERYLNV